jgi:hypothetical protein
MESNGGSAPAWGAAKAVSASLWSLLVSQRDQQSDFGHQEKRRRESLLLGTPRRANNMFDYDVIVIGGGPAGLAAAKSAFDNSAKTLLIEREGALGGILKQCIHDGFGLTRFHEKLSGPEYAYREYQKLLETKVDVLLLSFVTKLEKIEGRLPRFFGQPQRGASLRDKETHSRHGLPRTKRQSKS